MSESIELCIYHHLPQHLIREVLVETIKRDVGHRLCRRHAVQWDGRKVEDVVWTRVRELANVDQTFRSLLVTKTCCRAVLAAVQKYINRLDPTMSYQLTATSLKVAGWKHVIDNRRIDNLDDEIDDDDYRDDDDDRHGVRFIGRPYVPVCLHDVTYGASNKVVYANNIRFQFRNTPYDPNSDPNSYPDQIDFQPKRSVLICQDDDDDNQKLEFETGSLVTCRATNALYVALRKIAKHDYCRVGDSVVVRKFDPNGVEDPRFVCDPLRTTIATTGSISLRASGNGRYLMRVISTNNSLALFDAVTGSTLFEVSSIYCTATLAMDTLVQYEVFPTDEHAVCFNVQSMSLDDVIQSPQKCTILLKHPFLPSVTGRSITGEGLPTTITSESMTQWRVCLCRKPTKHHKGAHWWSHMRSYLHYIKDHLFAVLGHPRDIYLLDTGAQTVRRIYIDCHRGDYRWMHISYYWFAALDFPSYTVCANGNLNGDCNSSPSFMLLPKRPVV